jgi:hypothetical protein
LRNDVTPAKEHNVTTRATPNRHAADAVHLNWPVATGATNAGAIEPLRAPRHARVDRRRHPLAVKGSRP